MQMQRNKMHAGANLEIGQRLDEIVSRNREAFRAQTQGIEMPGMLDVSWMRGKFKLTKLSKGLIIVFRNRASSLKEPLPARQLVQAKSRRDIHHIVLIAHIDHFIIPGAASRIALPGIAVHAV